MMIVTVEEVIAANARLEQEVVALKKENRSLRESADSLYGIISDAAETEVGSVVIENSTCYQDFVHILICNGYSVEVTPIHGGKQLRIAISEREDESNE